MNAVFAQQIFIERASLPPALIAHIKRLAAFQNPQFYEKQAMRLSTALTPRIIDCAEDLPGHIGLPRGCLDDLRDLIEKYGVKLEVDDLRIDGEPLDVRFHGELTPLQVRAAEALAAHETGVLSAPPGTGKTVVGAYLVAHRARNTLVIVHRSQLVDQWRAQLGLFLDLKPDSIGRIGGGKRKVIGEGFDDARLDTLFLTMPVAWKGTLVQYAGRLHRAQQGKTSVRIYDYVDRDVPMLARMFKKRLKGYRGMGYQIAEAPTEDIHDLTIEYDEEVM